MDFPSKLHHRFRPVGLPPHAAAPLPWWIEIDTAVERVTIVQNAMFGGRWQDPYGKSVVASTEVSISQWMHLVLRESSRRGLAWQKTRGGGSRQPRHQPSSFLDSQVPYVASQKMQRVAKAPSAATSIALDLIRKLPASPSRSLSGLPGLGGQNVPPKAWVPTPLVTETVVCLLFTCSLLLTYQLGRWLASTYDCYGDEIA